MSDYWENRKAWQMFDYMADAEKIADEISSLYLKASRHLSLDLEQIFERFQTKHRLSESEAREMLNTLQDSASLEVLKDALARGDEDKKKLLAKIEAPAYRARIERLQQLQNQIDQVMQSIYGQEQVENTNWYLDFASDVYYHSVFDIQQRFGYAFSFNLVSPEVIERVINSKWSGEHYSSRIWKNTQSLAQALKEELLVSLITGRTDRETAEIIASRFSQGAGVARRLVRTESCFVATQMDMIVYKECGVDEYLFVATLDLKTSEICRELDGQYFPVEQQLPGTNCPPMHPWCRSTTISNLTKEVLKKLKRRARNPVTGKTENVPADMTYKQWYVKYVTGNPTAEVNEKKIKNRAEDREQFERYKKVLGDDIPKSLDDFQDMKYSKDEQWKFAKLAYSRQNRLLKNPDLRLPGTENISVPDKKFTHYLFGGENESGLAKGRAFESRLGYNADNWKQLQREIISNASKYPAVNKGNNGYGDRYEQKMVLWGKNETPANVVVGWLYKPDGTVNMSSAYIKEVE